MPFPPLPASRPDPIFAISEAAKAAGPEAINGTVGILMDEDGKPLMLQSVRRAIADCGRTLSGQSFTYPHLLGVPEFKTAVTRLIFGNTPAHVASIATTGGTGAVAINLRLAKLIRRDIPVVLPTPSWPNHRQLIEGAEMPLLEAPYFQQETASIEGIADVLKRTSGPVLVLLQVGCHNPTGLDFTHADWEALADLCLEHSAIPLIDCAYQGFGEGLSEDMRPIRLFVERGVSTLVAWSASKNHTIYAERVGLACAVAEDEHLHRELERHYIILTRQVHSAAATLGQIIVAHTQAQYRAPWEREIQETRQTLRAKRERLQHLLPPAFHHCLQGKGMFAQLPLTQEQVIRLHKEHLVFLADDGRLNIGGVPMRRVEELAEKISKIV